MRRIDLQRNAQEKIDDAALLLDSGRASNSYYLAGYSVEIGLKACIARQISADTIPNLTFVKSIYSHNIRDLVKVAGLSAQLKDAQNASTRFATNWLTVCEWGPEERYNSIDFGTAQKMLTAVNEPQDGVFKWIREHW